MGAFLAGIAFMILVGRLILPRQDPASQTQRSQRNLRAQYGLQESNFAMTVPANSVLVGKTLAESRIGSAAGLIVMALERDNQVDTLPTRKTVLEGGDRLLVQGRLDRFEELRHWSDLVIEREAPLMDTLMSAQIKLVEVEVAENSSLIRELLHHSDFRRRFGANVVAIRRKELVRRVNLTNVPLRVGDRLLLQGSEEVVEGLWQEPRVQRHSTRHGNRADRGLPSAGAHLRGARAPRIPARRLHAGQEPHRRRLRLPPAGHLSRGRLEVMPDPDQVILGGDLLLIQGRPEDLDVLRGLQELDIGGSVPRSLNVFDSDRLATLEATLAPQSPLAGKRVAEANFRDKYGLELSAILRSGEAIRADLDQLELQFGDALLFVGPRQKLVLLGDDPGLLVLTPVGVQPPDTERAPVAAGIMLAVIIAVLIGWLPISIAAIIGACGMVLTRCLSMEQAYRAIEWRAVFLIAGMLPLGIAMQETGTAEYLAGKVMATLGELGPWPVIAGLYGVTALATMIIPTAALVVLMSPIVLSACAELRHHAADRDDGGGHGGLGELHQPDFAPGQYSRHGSGRLPVLGLHQDRRAAHAGHLRRRDVAATDILAADTQALTQGS